MDLIFSTPDKIDIGILHDYEFDLAYGRDENDFTLEMALKNHCCHDDYLVYMSDPQNRYEAPTEYGGVIDSIAVNTEAQTVTYSGRTWHGILSEKVIQPEDGQDYKVVSGEAHEVLRSLITDLDVADMFTVPEGASEIQIASYQFNRYVDAYTGISSMLADNGAKLTVTYENKMIVLGAVWLVDYSMNDEWDSSQVDFTIKKRMNPVNHLICLGQGDLKDRFKIHLFTDENGGVMPYRLTDNPVEDTDYILDTRYQQLFGSYEIAETYDYPSAGTQENYVRLETQPADWAQNYGSYFAQKSDGGFSALEATEQEVLSPVSAQPSNWATAYGNYYTADGKSVQGVDTSSYEKLKKKPSDWEKNWGNYYVHFFNGVEYSWQTVDSLSNDKYKAQTKQPSDWKTSASSYYQHKVITQEVKDKNGKPVKGADGKVKKTTKIGAGYESVKKVKKGKKESFPSWEKGKYFTRYTSRKAPNFKSGLDKYRLVKSTVAPAFTSGRYYTKTRVLVIPVFKPNVYYRVAYDHFADLVNYGIEKLEDINTNGDSIEIDLNLLGEYDIGDIVGARENTTGIEVWQPITKKIVNINRRGRSISYRIGDVSI